jgi:hypothetical protein
LLSSHALLDNYFLLIVEQQSPELCSPAPAPSSHGPLFPVSFSLAFPKAAPQNTSKAKKDLGTNIITYHVCKFKLTSSTGIPSPPVFAPAPDAKLPLPPLRPAFFGFAATLPLYHPSASFPLLAYDQQV